MPAEQKTSRGHGAVGGFAMLLAGTVVAALVMPSLFVTNVTEVVDDAPAPMPAVEFSISPTPAVSATPSTASAVKGRTANRLTISSLNIKAPVLTLGLESPQQVKTPSNPAEVALFDQTAPCHAYEGTSLINGHVSAFGVKGALISLAKVKPDALVTWTCPDATLTKWQVVAVRVWHKYEPDSRYDPSIFDTTGLRRLVIVSCAGEVLTSGPYKGHYRDNVAVYAAPAD